MAKLASVKVGFRTALGFTRRETRNHNAACGYSIEDRHLLAYPVTRMQ